MTVKELIKYYAEQKLEGRLTKTDIRLALKSKHNYSEEEASELMTEIYDYELILVENQKTPIQKLLSSVFISYFFLLFGIGAICYTIFVLQENKVTALDKILPWILISGACLLIFKHAVIIYKHQKQK